MVLVAVAFEKTEQHDVHALSEYAVVRLLQCQGSYLPCGRLLGEPLLVGNFRDHGPSVCPDSLQFLYRSRITGLGE